MSSLEETPEALLLENVLDDAVIALSDAGCESPRADAETLIAGVLGIAPADIAARLATDVAPELAREIDERVARRVEREPLAYIVGHCRFRDIDVAVDERVLIPRRETSLLVEAALELPEGAWVHEVGTGSGAVALAILSERPDLRVTASDLSPDAADVARTNAQRLGLALEVTVARGLPDLGGQPDLIVANLPYITDTTIEERSQEIRFEPAMAVSGGAGADGLGVIRELVSQTPSGWRLAMEHDTHHGPTMRELLRDAETRRDHEGDERATVGRAP